MNVGGFTGEKNHSHSRLGISAPKTVPISLHCNPKFLNFPSTSDQDAQISMEVGQVVIVIVIVYKRGKFQKKLTKDVGPSPMSLPIPTVINMVSGQITIPPLPEFWEIPLLAPY